MNFLRGFVQKYKINWKFSPTGGSGGGAPPNASESFRGFPKFSSCHFNFFLKFVGWPPRHMIINHYFSEYKGVRGGGKPPAPEKIDIFYGKIEIFLRDFKEFNVKWYPNVISIRKWDFSQNSWEKVSNFFKLLLFCHTVSKTCWQIDIGSDIHSTYFNTKQHWTIIRHYVWENFFEKNTKRWLKFERILHFDFNFYLKITISSELMKNRPKQNFNFSRGWGVKSPFSKILGGLGGGGWAGVCINHWYYNKSWT